MREQNSYWGRVRRRSRAARPGGSQSGEVIGSVAGGDAALPRILAFGTSRVNQKPQPVSTWLEVLQCSFSSPSFASLVQLFGKPLSPDSFPFCHQGHSSSSACGMVVGSSGLGLASSTPTSGCSRARPIPRRAGRRNSCSRHSGQPMTDSRGDEEEEDSRRLGALTRCQTFFSWICHKNPTGRLYYCPHFVEDSEV